MRTGWTDDEISRYTGLSVNFVADLRAAVAQDGEQALEKYRISAQGRAVLLPLISP